MPSSCAAARQHSVLTCPTAGLTTRYACARLSEHSVKVPLKVKHDDEHICRTAALPPPCSTAHGDTGKRKQ